MARILLIEDSPAIRSATREILHDAGHDITSAGSAEKGKDMITPDMDLLICDVVLPGQSGWELCQEIKSVEAIKDIPVIFLTSKVTKKHQLKSKLCGGAKHINKPFKYDELLKAVETVLYNK